MKKNLFHVSTDEPTGAPHLVVIFPGEQGKPPTDQDRFDIDQLDMILGSSPDAQIQLMHPSVKPLHLRLYQQGTQWWVEDLTDSFQLTVQGLIVRLFPIREDGFSFQLGPLLCRFFLGNSDDSTYDQFLYNIAQIDSLTHVPNRSVFEKGIRRALEHFRSSGHIFSLIILDLDHFREINNTHGHSAGDTVLRTIAWRITEDLRKTELLCRIGGEEFVILLPNTEAKAAHDIAERTRLTVQRDPVRAGEHDLWVTASFGIATVEQNDTEESIFKRADAFLYDAKQAGRNQVKSALSPSLDAAEQ